MRCAERRAGVEIGEQRLAKSGQVRPCVERPEGPAGEKLGIVRLEVEADIEGLLHVGTLLRIERLMHEAGIAAVAADRFDRDGLLFGEGQREERLRLREGRVHQVAADAVIDDVEKADVAAGRADAGRDVRERAVVVAAGRKIDDRQCTRHVWLPCRSAAAEAAAVEFDDGGLEVAPRGEKRRARRRLLARIPRAAPPRPRRDRRA